MSGAITDSCLLAQRGVCLELELLVLTHRVQHDTSVGLVDPRIIQEALDLVVHVFGVPELPDRDDIGLAGHLVNGENLAVLTEVLSHIRKRASFYCELHDGCDVISQRIVVYNR